MRKTIIGFSVALFGLLFVAPAVADHRDNWREKRIEREYERERDYRDRRRGRRAKEYRRRARRNREHGVRRRHRREYIEYRYGGPPPWASARDHRRRYWRRRQRRQEYGTTTEVYIETYEVDVEPGPDYVEVDPGEAVVVPDSGVGHCNRAFVGTIVGGVTGGVIGSHIGKGDGKALATIGGVIIGALVGGSIGHSMDDVDHNCVGQALERTPTGRTVEWTNPDNGAEYQVTPIKTYQETDGQYCREYQTKIVVGGEVENAYGTACRQPDGSWKTTQG